MSTSTDTMRPDAVLLRLDDRDNVAVTKRALTRGQRLREGAWDLTVTRDIPPGHKVALAAIAADAPIVKYGQWIGFATERIAPGDHVHVHNVAMRPFTRAAEPGVDARPVDYYPADRIRTFSGYPRADGRVGTRNYLAVIASVNCSASVSRYIAEHFRGPDFGRDYTGVDGVIAFTHKTGCAIQPGEPLRVLQRVMAGLVRHPNIGGCVLVGLGCEVNQITDLVQAHQLEVARPGEPPLRWLNIQSTGGVRKTVEAGVAAVRALLPRVKEWRRTPQPASHLVLATNCGGSDGNSGITANPALGVAADELVRHYGTAVLAETPEIYGAEHLLIRRASSREAAEKLAALIRWWEAHVQLFGATIDNNPTVGNKAGGLTTIYEKSLGAIAKGGHSPLAAVYQYAEPVTARGFCFMDTPGYDPVSMTGLMAGGCNVGVFTTGRGSVYGYKPTPCIKVATHTPLFEAMRDDMDLNAGTILDGSETVAEVGGRIFEKLIAVANGERTRSELAGIGDEEFAPWVLGPTF